MIKDALGDSDNSRGLNTDLPAAGRCPVPSVPVQGTSWVCSGAAAWTLMPPNTALHTELLSSGGRRAENLASHVWCKWKPLQGAEGWKWPYSSRSLPITRSELEDPQFHLL